MLSKPQNTLIMSTLCEYTFTYFKVDVILEYRIGVSFFSSDAVFLHDINVPWSPNNSPTAQPTNLQLARYRSYMETDTVFRGII